LDRWCSRLLDRPPATWSRRWTGSWTRSSARKPETSLPPQVRAGFAQVRFETIHPYLDGNGRVGRMLIALCLEDWRLMSNPLLYLSCFFKTHRSEYYDRLEAVRTQGEWESWLACFLE
jgi:Fic family protein